MNMSNTTYPNLMCFGRDISNCPITETCPYYEECQEEYKQSWLSLFKYKVEVNK